MIIPVNSEFRIASDPYCWTVQRPVNRNNKDTGESYVEWRAFRWYPTIEAAVNGLAQESLRASEAEPLTDALAEVKRVVAEVTRAFQPRFEVKDTRIS